MSDFWLILYASALATCGILSYRSPKMMLLSALLAINALVYLLLPPLGVGGYMLAGLSDLAIALACVCIASRPASWIALLSCLGMVCNFGMFVWYHHPAPYDVFMIAYTFYPDAIRGIELAQLLVILTGVPAFRGRATNKDKGEPPCRYLMVRPSRLL